MHVPPLLLGLVLVTAPGVVGETAPAPPLSAPEATIRTIRLIGSAMVRWMSDRSPDRGDAEENEEEESEPTTADWSRCPAITHEEAARLLVPKYIAELPTADGWGHSLQLCLRRGPVHPGDHSVAGIRSAGRDGRFEATSYRVGSFPAADLDRDIVWLDGFLVAWPEKP